MKINEVDFNYNDTITVVSKKQFDAHKSLYSGYVSKTNEITDILETNGQRPTANSTYSHYRGLKQGETFAIDGVILHELYFENIGGLKIPTPQIFLRIVNKYFGSFDNWKDDFIACATASRGWCVFSYEQRTRSFRNFSQDFHNEGVVVSAYPILVIDMYEHAYFFDYLTNKNAYIINFLSNINWAAVENRMSRLQINNL